MNSTEIFTLALVLKEAWEITDIEISVDKDSIKALHIHLVLSVVRNLMMRRVLAAQFMIRKREAGDICTFLNIAVIFIVQFLGFERVMARYD